MTALTTRQEKILRTVVEHHISTGRPVGSNSICEKGAFRESTSTIRSELACLEEMGYLSQPHTSAGRVPTDTGYRCYVDDFFGARRVTADMKAIDAENLGDEIEDALRRSAKLLAGNTGLLALVSAPSQDTSTIKHVEVLHLQPDLIMVVVITDDGEIVKKLFLYNLPVDGGLVSWAKGYLNEAVCGLGVGSNILRIRLLENDLKEAEGEFIKSLAPVFSTRPDGGSKSLFVEGLPGFFDRYEEEAAIPVHIVRGLLERQEEILKLLKSALMEPRVYLRIGREMPSRSMSECSLVAANYGVAWRNLGTVGVLGPTRIDYGNVICCVEKTAQTLSRFVEERYQA